MKGSKNLGVSTIVPISIIASAALLLGIVVALYYAGIASHASRSEQLIIRGYTLDSNGGIYVCLKLSCVGNKPITITDVLVNGVRLEDTNLNAELTWEKEGSNDPQHELPFTISPGESGLLKIWSDSWSRDACYEIILHTSSGIDYPYVVKP